MNREEIKEYLNRKNLLIYESHIKQHNISSFLINTCNVTFVNLCADKAFVTTEYGIYNFKTIEGLENVLNSIITREKTESQRIVDFLKANNLIKFIFYDNLVYENTFVLKMQEEVFVTFENNKCKVITPFETKIVKTEKEFVDFLEQTKREFQVPDDVRHLEKVFKGDDKKEDGYVYLMIDHNTKLYKIGWSKQPKVREKTLQSEQPKIELLKSFRTNKSSETELHRYFKDKRIRGEWFNLTPSDLNLIDVYFQDKNELL